MTPLAVTVKQAANALAVSERTIRRMLDSGELIEVRIRGARRVQYASLESLCQKQAPEVPIAAPATSTSVARELDQLLAQRTRGKRAR